MANVMAIPVVPSLTHLTRRGEINSLVPNKCSISNLNVPKFAGLNLRCARVGGVEIPNNKRIEYSLQYIHGIGRTTARQVLYDLAMENKVTRELNENELTRVRDEVSKYMIEGDLRRFNNLAIRINTFSVLQAETMDRHLGKHFQIPAGSFGIFTMLALTLFLPFYDKFIVPFSRRVTKEGKGITLLQRVGVGLALTILSMAFAAAVETKRRTVALSHDFMEKPKGAIHMSALWLIPQYSLAGVAEAFSAIGEIEFLYSQFPENMRSVAGALFFLSLGLGNYLSSLVVSIVHKTTGGRGHENWLAQNLNKGKLDNFYWLLAGYSAVNLMYFVICARWYRYKATVHGQTAKTSLSEQDNPTLPHA